MRWTPEFDQYIRDNYQSMTKKQIAEALGIAYGTIIGHAAKLGMQKHKRKKKVRTCRRFPDSIRQNFGLY